MEIAAPLNRLNELFRQQQQNRKLLNIYFTAGYPSLESTGEIISQLEKAGVDMVEIGMPFSDPLADGPTIQKSSETALANGMTLEKLLSQLETITTEMPIILMGYLNPVLQYGVERFVERAAALNVSGVILPDLPLEVYLDRYQALFRRHGLAKIFLVSPQTSPERIRLIDQQSDSFIYAVSSASTTGKSQAGLQTPYLQRLAEMQLKSPLMVGFNVKDRASFEAATAHAQGAIIGSAFIRAIDQTKQEAQPLSQSIPAFVRSIRPEAAELGIGP